MGEITDNQHEVSDPLHLDRCPDCGYLLTGLPERGRCPECGFVYGPELIVLYGWRFSFFGQEKPEPLWQQRLSLVYLISAIGVTSYLLYRTSWGPNAWIWLWALPVWWQAGKYIWRYVTRDASLADAPAPVQVRLQAEGYSERDGVGPAKLNPWPRKLVFKIRSVGQGYCRLRIGYFREGYALYQMALEFKGRGSVADSLRQRLQQWCPTAAFR